MDTKELLSQESWHIDKRCCLITRDGAASTRRCRTRSRWGKARRWERAWLPLVKIWTVDLSWTFSNEGKWSQLVFLFLQTPAAAWALQVAVHTRSWKDENWKWLKSLRQSSMWDFARNPAITQRTLFTAHIIQITLFTALSRLHPDCPHNCDYILASSAQCAVCTVGSPCI